MESILTSIKKLLGITEFYEHFDADIIMHINTVFAILTQMGVGPANGFSIIDKSAKWDEFVSNKIYLEPVKTYVYLKVKLIFDPPLSSSVAEAMKQTINELECRLYLAADTKSLQGEEVTESE